MRTDLAYPHFGLGGNSPGFNSLESRYTDWKDALKMSHARLRDFQNTINTKRENKASEEAGIFFDALSKLGEVYHEIYQSDPETSSELFAAITEFVNAVSPDKAGEDQATITAEQKACDAFFARINTLQHAERFDRNLAAVSVSALALFVGIISGLIIASGGDAALAFGCFILAVSALSLLTSFCQLNPESPSPRQREIKALNNVLNASKAARKDLFPQKQRASSQKTNVPGNRAALHTANNTTSNPCCDKALSEGPSVSP